MFCALCRLSNNTALGKSNISLVLLSQGSAQTLGEVRNWTFI